MVTDEMVEAGLQHYSEGGCSGLDENERREVVESILNAAFAAMPGQAVTDEMVGTYKSAFQRYLDGLPAYLPTNFSWEATKVGIKAILDDYGYMNVPVGKVRDLAVDIVDGALGYTCEYSTDIDYHQSLYDVAEQSILSALKPAPDLASENERLRAALEMISAEAKESNEPIGRSVYKALATCGEIADIALERQ